MRARGSSDGLTVLGIAGNHVAMFGWDMSRADIEAKHVLGFAIRRTRLSDGDCGVTVEIIYDDDSAGEENRDALAAAATELVDATRPREHSGGFAHNKFLIYAPHGEPTEVWTGSANLSQNGIYGHSNNAHILRDADVAARYEEYWQLLLTDVTRKPTATAATALTPAPADSPTDALPVFSPRLDLGALQWYAELAGKAERGLFMTFAFGMNDLFVKVYDRTDDVIRFALMEKEGTGRQVKEQTATIERIRRRPNVTVSVGNRVELNAFDRWLKEISNPFADNVFYIHTKYMLVDPLGDDPVIVMGSANFSKASTTDNDENMLVIRGNPSVADVYLGEFMRLFTHYAFRESLRFHGVQPRNEMAAMTRGHLAEDTSWADERYFTPGQDRFLRRLYFSGQ